MIFLRVLIAGSMTTTGKLIIGMKKQELIPKDISIIQVRVLNFRDDEFNTLARTNSEKKYFLSDDVIDASYGGTPPSSFAEITSMDHVVLSGESGNSGFNAK